MLWKEFCKLFCCFNDLIRPCVPNHPPRFLFHFCAHIWHTHPFHSPFISPSVLCFYSSLCYNFQCYTHSFFPPTFYLPQYFSVIFFFSCLLCTSSLRWHDLEQLYPFTSIEILGVKAKTTSLSREIYSLTSWSSWSGSVCICNLPLKGEAFSLHQAAMAFLDGWLETKSVNSALNI